MGRKGSIYYNCTKVFSVSFSFQGMTTISGAARKTMKWYGTRHICGRRSKDKKCENMVLRGNWYQQLVAYTLECGATIVHQTALMIALCKTYIRSFSPRMAITQTTELPTVGSCAVRFASQTFCNLIQPAHQHTRSEGLRPLPSTLYIPTTWPIYLFIQVLYETTILLKRKKKRQR